MAPPWLCRRCFARAEPQAVWRRRPRRRRWWRWRCGLCLGPGGLARAHELSSCASRSHATPRRQRTVGRWRGSGTTCRQGIAWRRQSSRAVLRTRVECVVAVRGGRRSVKTGHPCPSVVAWSLRGLRLLRVFRCVPRQCFMTLRRRVRGLHVPRRSASRGGVPSRSRPARGAGRAAEAVGRWFLGRCGKGLRKDLAMDFTLQKQFDRRGGRPRVRRVGCGWR